MSDAERGGAYGEPELEAAIERLADGARLREAEATVAAAAPALQRVLLQALASGGWFEGSHRGELERVSAIDDPGERATAVATLLAEETRIAMMIGVTVGWTLADDLRAAAGEPGLSYSQKSRPGERRIAPADARAAAQPLRPGGESRPRPSSRRAVGSNSRFVSWPGSAPRS